MTRTPTERREAQPDAEAVGRRAGQALPDRAGDLHQQADQQPDLGGGRQGRSCRMDVRFGATGTPTREGSFSVQRKERTWTSTIYHSKMPYSMFFSGGQAVHYSSDFAARGYAGASHGCVNVRNLAGITSLFSQARNGDKVIVYR